MGRSSLLGKGRQCLLKVIGSGEQGPVVLDRPNFLGKTGLQEIKHEDYLLILM